MNRSIPCCTAAAIALFSIAASGAKAQPPPGGRFGPPPGGFGPRMGPRPFGGPRRATTAIGVPVAYLESELKLTAAQKSKIEKIRQKFRDGMRAQFPGPPGFGGPGEPPPGGRVWGPPPGGPPSGVGPGGPPDPKRFEAAMKKVQALEKKASAEVEAVLTARQKPALKQALKDADTLRQVGIPLQIAGQLKLTRDQKNRLAAIATRNAGKQPGNWFQARQQTEKASMDVLGAQQRKVLETFRRSRPGPGGPGNRGFGPPPGWG